MKNKRQAQCAALTLFLLASGIMSSTAQTLLLDFGPTTVTGTDRSNSPYHSINASAGTNWNQIQATDVTSGLLYADGAAASGVTVDLGRSSSVAWKTLTMAGQPGSVSLGTITNTGVFDNTAVGRDAINYGSSATQNTLVGLAIGGLAAGTYEIYIVGFNTNQGIASAAQESFWALATSSTANLDTTALLSSPQATSLNNVSSSWVENGNYVKLTATLTAGEYLTIFSTGSSATEYRGFLNSVEIVAIPEPSTMILAVGGVVIAMGFSKRKRAVGIE